MASVRVHTATGFLFIDFRFNGVRCREYTALPDTSANRKQLEKLRVRLEVAIADGSFRYRNFFPSSKAAARFDIEQPQTVPPNKEALPAYSDGLPTSAGDDVGTAETQTASFSEFAGDWYDENQIRWRKSYRKTVRDIIDRHLAPAFADKVVGRITRAEILKFRSTLAKVPGRKNKDGLSAARINYIMKILGQIMTEAADRHQFNNPYRDIKPLKLQKVDVEPFSLGEVQRILDAVRPDFKDYFLVRFFTGMRTGEIDGLKWEYVDFERRQILVRETIVAGEEEYTKTDGSQREIQMSLPVLQALQRQAAATRDKSPYVFCNASGQPLDHNNVTRRVWYPLLRYLGIKPRRPYQTRHTAATLWLAAGENPQWIARQLGHVSTDMLFRVYARYVPNLTRQDGSAFERLLLTQTATVATVAGHALNNTIHESVAEGRGHHE